MEGINILNRSKGLDPSTAKLATCQHADGTSIRKWYHTASEAINSEQGPFYVNCWLSLP